MATQVTISRLLKNKNKNVNTSACACHTTNVILIIQCMFNTILAMIPMCNVIAFN